jgi:hypothetical protein
VRISHRPTTTAVEAAQLRRPHSGTANIPQYLFAQNIGVAFTGFRKRDELRGDRLFDALVAVSSPQSVDAPTL